MTSKTNGTEKPSGCGLLLIAATVIIIIIGLVVIANLISAGIGIH